MSIGKLSRTIPLIALWLGGASAAKADFLQPDPVGYKQSLNLYVYAGNDPINNVDPDGKTCVRAGTSDAPTYTCKVDFVRTRDGTIRAPTAAENRQLASFNRSYTRAVNQLMANPNRSVRIVIPGPGRESSRSFSTTAGEVGQSLVSRRFISDPNNSGGAVTGRGYTTVYREGLQGAGVGGRNVALGQRILVTHEGIHRRPAENRMLIAPSLGVPPWDDAHQDPYNAAARALLGE